MKRGNAMKFIWLLLLLLLSLGNCINTTTSLSSIDLRLTSSFSSTILRTSIDGACLRTDLEATDCRHVHVFYADDVRGLTSQLRVSYLGALPLVPVQHSFVIQNANDCNLIDKNFIGEHYASICGTNDTPFLLLVIDWDPKLILMNQEDVKFWSQQQLHYTLVYDPKILGIIPVFAPNLLVGLIITLFFLWQYIGSWWIEYLHETARIVQTEGSTSKSHKSVSLHE